MPPLRWFVVHHKVDGVAAPYADDFVEAHAMEREYGILAFVEYCSETLKGNPIVVRYERRAFNEWSDVEEIVIDGISGIRH